MMNRFRGDVVCGLAFMSFVILSSSVRGSGDAPEPPPCSEVAGPFPELCSSSDGDPCAAPVVSGQGVGERG